jgi:hypothetical protein
VLLEKAEHPPPCIRRRAGELLLLSVEEAVRRAVVGDDLVLDAGLGEG